MTAIVNITIVLGLIGYGLLSQQPLWGVVGGLLAIASAIGELVDRHPKP